MARFKHTSSKCLIFYLSYRELDDRVLFSDSPENNALHGLDNTVS